MDLGGETADRVLRDRTRERAAVLNQLLLGLVVLILAFMIVVAPAAGDLGLFFTGIVAIFAATALTVLVPWNRVSASWLVIVPIVDIVAITIMRLGGPNSGVGLLWIFPAMWLASSWGLAGAIGGAAGILVGFAITVLAQPTRPVGYATLLLPLVVMTVSGASYLTARRSAAQRSLLDKQAAVLSHALERARRQELEVEELLDAAEFGLIRIAEDGAVTIVNEAPGQLQRALLRGDGDGDGGVRVFSADGVTPMPAERMPVERALRGEAFDAEVLWFGESGPQNVALAVTVRRLTGPHGEDVGAVLVSRDVTSELRALQARDQLVASVSHELRTPLTSILGYLDLAIDDPQVPASARRGLEIAERNAERLLGIVADILAASSASSRPVELTVSPVDVDVADIVRASVESLEPRAAERGVTLDDSGVEDAVAFVDPMRARQIVDNLIANAIAYNSEAGSVTVGATTDGDSTWVLVRDTGIGMTEEEMSGLFVRFYRTRGAQSGGRRGTGLGLAISRDLARAHGGDITVRSTPGAGSTFILRLPATRAASAPAPRVPERVAAARREPTAPTAARSEGEAG
ncbi:sensor histidine kinase [Microbacterium mangrovi]|uniref:sensor histidine kinase n=1 Tax=Microbacterium mangrovi TaxID=1348253 RepID=UPI001E4729D0|nr:HAMP domain-containing sensor histidine kinase [Microbacterium mangrovi]